MTYVMVGAGALLLAVAPEAAFAEEQRLLATCLSGGIAGGLLAVLLFPTTSTKQMAGKWLGSSVAAALFGPAACKYMDQHGDLVNTLAIAGGIGLLSWAVLLAVVPLVARIAKWAVKDRVPGAFEEEKKP